MSRGQDARVGLFLDATEPHERDWVAFFEFERAIRSAVGTASLIDEHDTRPERDREREGLHMTLSGMLFGVLLRVDLGTVLAGVEGIGYALRHGLIDARSDALDDVADAAAYEELAARGYGADQAYLGGLADREPKEPTGTEGSLPPLPEA